MGSMKTIRTKWFEKMISMKMVRKMNNNSLQNSDQMIYFERMTLKSIQNSDKNVILKK